MTTEGNNVYDSVTGELLGTVDRTCANERDYGDDAHVRVSLPCGYKLQYFLTDLSNEEYIRRTILLKKES